MTQHEDEATADDAEPTGIGAVVEDVGARVSGVMRWADDLQRRVPMLGFPYAVIKKYGDDAGGREAALITYYGFLSIFPILLLVTATISRILVDNADLRSELISGIVPPDLQEAVDSAVASMPTSGLPFFLGILGLLFAGTGVVFSAYETLNHIAGIPHRKRFEFIPRYARVLLVLLVLLVGAFAVGAVNVAAGLFLETDWVGQLAVALGSALVVFLVLMTAARLLIARPVPISATWPAALTGAVVITLLLTLGTRILAMLVAKSGPVYGAFATVVGMFSLLYLVSQALVYGAEVAVVRRARLWPRALDLTRPTDADRRALARLAHEQERIAPMRVESHVDP